MSLKKAVQRWQWEQDYQDLSDFDRQVHDYLGLPIADEAPTDYYTNAIINIFWLANRGRSYLSGMAISPLPLTVKNISDVLEAYPIDLPRDWVDKAVFAIDDEYLERVRESA